MVSLFLRSRNLKSIFWSKKLLPLLIDKNNVTFRSQFSVKSLIDLQSEYFTKPQINAILKLPIIILL
jgi:hypothetical protein